MLWTQFPRCHGHKGSFSPGVRGEGRFAGPAAPRPKLYMAHLRFRSRAGLSGAEETGAALINAGCYSLPRHCLIAWVRPQGGSPWRGARHQAGPGGGCGWPERGRDTRGPHRPRVAMATAPAPPSRRPPASRARPAP